MDQPKPMTKVLNHKPNHPTNRLMKKLLPIAIMLTLLLPAAHVAMAGKRASRDTQDNASAPAATPSGDPNAAAPARTGLRLPTLFSDHMILQQKTKNTIWGWASPGENVTVTASWGATASTTAGADGKWKLFLDTPAFGTGHSLTIKGKNTIPIKDVAIGEVWRQRQKLWPCVLMHAWFNASLAAATLLALR